MPTVHRALAPYTTANEGTPDMARKDETQDQPEGEAQSEATGTQVITIQDLRFQAPAPYAEGHPCNAAEAATLNQTLGENLRNNFSKKVKDAKDKWEKEHPGEPFPESEAASLQSQFATYAASYEFHGKRSTRAPRDPILSEARKLAREAIERRLKEKNIEKKSLAEGQMDRWIDGLLEKEPGFMEEARRRHAATKEIAAAALEGIAG